MPIFVIISISVSDEQEILRNGYWFFPRVFSGEAYKTIFRTPGAIIRSYQVSMLVTAAGCVLGVIVSSLIAYPLSRQIFRFKGIVSFLVFFTMLFNGGLVPWYMVVTRVLGLGNSIFALILPYVFSAWYILLLRTYFKRVPTELIESAYMDGANEPIIFARIIVPLSKPAIATIALFYLLRYWNDWWLALLYIDDQKLAPLQFMLYRIMANIQFITQMMTNTTLDLDTGLMPKETVRMAMCMVACGPMLFVFPFFQKYFVKGITVGAIKG